MPADPRDYKVELSAEAMAAAADDASTVGANVPSAPDAEAVAGPQGPGASRPFLSINFACCGAYARAYRSTDATHYAARCPRCGKPVRFAVGPGGTSARSFTVR